MNNRRSPHEFARRHPAVARTIERLVLWPYRLKIRRRERARIRHLEGTIETLREELTKSHVRGTMDFSIVLNAELYAVLFDRDFAALKEFFLTADNDWDRRFVARQMAVMLYEGTKDLPVLIGKDFRAMMKRLEFADHRTNEVNQIRSKLAGFKHAHSERLKELRNVMAAHRERDAALQLRLLDSLDKFEVYRTAVEFLWDRA